jgi:nitrile hydratase
VNGVHDMGGMHGFGPVVPEANEPVFHHEWERRVFALSLAMGAWRRWNIDMSRFAREQQPPAEYLAASYYEHWLFGLEKLLVEKGFLEGDELARHRARIAAPARPAGRTRFDPAPGALRAAGVERMLRNRRAARLDDPVPPKFAPGDQVIARNTHPVGHTRLPRYVRGRRGVVDRDRGVFIFPDTHALGQGTKPQHVYSVRFAARELWGPEASPRDSVYVDLWDDYLEPGPAGALAGALA